MFDFAWLSSEAKNIHSIFVNVFYAASALLIVLGVMVELFKIPTGGMPIVAPLIGRALIAAILLIAYPEISNAISSLADAVANKLGSLNNIHLVLKEAKHTLTTYGKSWTSLGDTIIWIIAYLGFFCLYVTVFFFDAAIVYCITLLYIFSPILIAFYILPQTANMTKGLFKTLFEIASWKIIWSVLATLLWSSALRNYTQQNTNFITQLALTLLLILSIVLTPMIAKSIISGTLAGATSKLAGYAGAGIMAGFLTPSAITGFASKGTKLAGKTAFKATRGTLRYTARSSMKAAKFSYSKAKSIFKANNQENNE